jgi:hypothetical protein
MRMGVVLGVGLVVGVGVLVGGGCFCCTWGSG